LRIYETIGYDGLNIGDNDLILGVEYLRALQKYSKIPFLSANIREKETGKPIFTPYLVKEMDGIRIGIIGVLTPDIAPSIAEEIDRYFIEDPSMAAIEIINGPMANCDYIIALAHLNPSEIEFLAQVAPHISVIIGGHDRSPVYPRVINRAIWVQTDAFGLSIGKLDLKFLKGSSEFVDVTQRNLIQKNIDEIQKKIEDPRHVKEGDGLKGMREMLIEQKKKMPDAVGKNTYENRLTLLHPGMESDKEIENLIDSLRDQLKRPLP
jgi:2',3'-cyclic-nucleotide 2'-phosphodiesterase (5'-nucleotidase family)